MSRRQRVMLSLTVSLLALPMLAPSCFPVAIESLTPQQDALVCQGTHEVVADFLIIPVSLSAEINGTLVGGIDSVPVVSDISPLLAVDGFFEINGEVPMMTLGRNYLSMNVDNNLDGQADTFESTTFDVVEFDPDCFDLAPGTPQSCVGSAALPGCDGVCTHDVPTFGEDRCGEFGANEPCTVARDNECMADGFEGCMLGQSSCFGTLCGPGAFGPGCLCANRGLDTAVNTQRATTSGSQYGLRNDVPDDLTVELWINPDAVSSGTLLSKGGNWAVRLASGKIRAQSGGSSLVTAATVSPGEWTHLAVTFEGQGDGTADIEFFLNGVRDTSSGSINLNPPNTIPLNVLQTRSGSIDELRLWNTIRSQTEIVNNIFGSVNTSPDLRGYWRFDEAAAGPWLDYSYYGNSLSPVAGASATASSFPPVNAEPTCPTDDGGLECSGAGSCNCGVCACTNGETTPNCAPNPLI